MKISKRDALLWFRFFAALPEDQPLGIRQQEIALAVFPQIEAAAEARFQGLQADIPGLKKLGSGPSTFFVGPEERFPGGCRSCLLGTGLSAVRKTNRCDAACPFCYDYGVLDTIPPIGEGLWESAAAGIGRRIWTCSLPCRGNPPASPMCIWSR